MQDLLQQIKDFLQGDYYINHVVVGGLRGGSCWDTRRPYPYETDDEMDYSDLKQFIESIGLKVPDTDLDEFIELNTYKETESEYYGNYSEYRYVIIPAQEIYEACITNFERLN